MMIGATRPSHLAGLSCIGIATGFYQTCGITGGGGIKCWGDVNQQPQPADVTGAVRSSRASGGEEM